MMICLSRKQATLAAFGMLFSIACDMSLAAECKVTAFEGLVGDPNPDKAALDRLAERDNFRPSTTSVHLSVVAPVIMVPNGGDPGHGMTPERKEQDDIRKAIDRGDLQELTKLLPRDGIARREALRRTHAIVYAFAAGALSIEQQILRWDSGALKAEPQAYIDSAITRLTMSWEQVAIHRGKDQSDTSIDGNYLELLRILLDARANPEGAAKISTPLATLARSPSSPGIVSAVSLLVERGASLDPPNGPLRAAVEANNLAVVEIILRQGRLKKESVDEAAGWARIGINNKAIALLVAAGADVNALSRLRYSHPDFRPAVEPSEFVRRGGDRELMRLMLRNKVDLKAPAGKPSALSYFAADPEFVALLLAGGADPNHRDGGGETPLLLATRIGDSPYRGINRDPYPHSEVRLRTVELLLAAGADPSIANKSGRTPLMQTMNDETALVNALLARGGTIRLDPRLVEGNKQRGFPIGPISWTVLAHKDALGAVLAARQGKLDPDDCGAVYYAALSGSVRTLAALLDIKAPLHEAKDPIGMTPMIAAAQAGQVATVKILLDRHVAAVDEETPRSIAMMGNGHGPSMPAPVGGETALMLAARSGSVDVVRELIRRGADVKRKSFSGRTALDYAERMPEMAALLREQGAH